MKERKCKILYPTTPVAFPCSLMLTVGFILACGAGSPTEQEAPEPQIVYNDGIAKLGQPVPGISVCERNSMTDWAEARRYLTIRPT